MSNYTNDCDTIMYHLAKIVDMYLDEEQNHYEESVAMNKFKNGGEKNHIFHNLLAVSHWIKENHTMPDIDESENMPPSKSKNVEGYIEVSEDIMYRRPVWYEEVPDEDLWQDGELDQCERMANIERNLYIGKYKLIRRKHDRKTVK